MLTNYYKIRNASILIALLISNFIFAQYTVEGTVKDIDTNEPLSNIIIHINHIDSSTPEVVVITDKLGYFNIDIDEEFGEIDLEIYHYNYRDYYKVLNIYDDSDSSFIGKVLDNFDVEILLYSYDSDSYIIEDIAEIDVFDFTLGFDVFSPKLNETDNKFSSVFSVYYAGESKIALADRLQLGINYMPLKLKWMKMNNDATITSVSHNKEQYFEASTSLGIFTRYIITTGGKKRYRGMFVDLGVSYTIPYYFSYTYFTDNHTRTSQNRIHNFKDFQAMFRLGYYWGSIRANYRFTDIMKDGYIQQPRVNLAIEFNIPMIDQ